jgi:hypothetical protein
MNQIQMGRQDYHAKLVDSRNELLRIKKQCCDKKTEYENHMKQNYESVPGDRMTKNEKELIKGLKELYSESSTLLKTSIEKFITMMEPVMKMGTIGPWDLTVEQRHIVKYMEMWERLPYCFAELLLEITTNNDIRRVKVADVIDASKFHKELDHFQLIEENDTIHLVDPETGFKSDPVIACHVSSGSLTNHGYRYANFITQQGYVYWGPGEMDRESFQILDKKVQILTK